MTLNHNDFMRYSRHMLMADIGATGQEKLAQAKVLIVGLGGLGCPVALYLAAAGVGHLSLCDGDVVELSNLQRQILYRESDCETLKVVCAERALQALNPNVQISSYAEPVTAAILAGDFDLVVDCTDNSAARHLINQHCWQHQRYFVSAAALGWEGQLVAFDFKRTRELCLNCIMDAESPEPMMNCASAGVVGPILGAMGSLQATTAIRMLLGYFAQHGEMQRYDGKAGRWLTLSARARADCSVCG